ncbi:hypothetical protein [Edaphobacter aggregans]|uniref:hypothetical protein n=1 Tax=Edaphobacter aggregans TaxID=570835 RepID=UPI000553B5F0|nr:hypothetical protein [Edaphobacter aggregans]
MIAQDTTRTTMKAAVLVFAMLAFVGCQSKQDKAIEDAKKQAAATGQAQQVVSVDKNGNTTTTTVQPPLPGQTGQQVTTTVTPASGVPANAPAVAGGQAAPVAQQATVMANGQPEVPAAQQQPAAGPASAAIAPADVKIPAGTTLAIRINQHISVKTSHAGDPFDGEIAEPVADRSGRLIVPKGTPVGGVVAESHKRGRFKGASVLQLQLTSMTLNGQRYPLETSSLTRTKKGKGKRSAAMIGGGAGLGMLVGGLATGGTGLLIGGLAGAGAGTAAAGLTGNGDIDIPSESIVRFKLAEGLSVQPS